MATLPVDRPVTPLRQRMLDDMATRSMRARTQHDYSRHVHAFAGFIGLSPDTATAEDVRRFQLHYREHGAGAAHPLAADVSGEQRTEPVPPEPYPLVADVDPALEQQVLHVPEQQWEAHVHQHHQPDHLRRRVEVAERTG